MIKVNKKILKTKPYVVSNRTNNTQIKKLDWNECTIPLSSEIQRVLNQAIKGVNLTEYPPIDNKKLIQKIAEYCGVQNENVEIFNGSDSALEYIFSCFVDEDISVLVYDPNYTQIDNLISLQTDKFYHSQMKNILTKPEYDFSEIDNADVIYISNPNNPTGFALEPRVIEDLVLQNESKLFIIDEAYYEFYGKSCCYLAKQVDNIIVTRTFSKALSLASIRLGYVCTSKKNVEIINKVKNKKEVNSFAQALGHCVLENIHLLQKRTEMVKENRNNFISDLKTKNIEHIESDSNFVLIKLKNHSLALSELLKNNFLVRDRSSIRGLENCIRITVDTAENMKIISNILQQTEETND
jgi:histidinol-phosphate aminotransferase